RGWRPYRLSYDLAAVRKPDGRLSRMTSVTINTKGWSNVARQAELGFTLVEMLVVITLISRVMGLVGPRVLSYLTESKVKTAKIQIESIESGLDLYFLDVGRYPTTSEGLGALLAAPGSSAVWNGPYLKGSVVPTDPWGTPYIYRSPGQHGA